MQFQHDALRRLFAQPLDGGQALDVRRVDRLRQIGGPHGGKRRDRKFRAHALHAGQPQKKFLFLQVGKAVERNALFGNLQIGIQLPFLPLFHAGEVGERRTRTHHFISHAVHVQKHAFRKQRQHFPAQISYHFLISRSKIDPRATSRRTARRNGW